ncbi:Stk1 family PASTA domain-containing Ser/Thr kinase [Demequina pelophila]|uniref:Stk1 family PASTA domain-containing Ser/Thr kinase n=1 Tax=Demequina pelophila TaxID=1638984 RepID=UPI000783E67B|nr:Stk1 family PASTA domain-containing Ser/Thr kinase [Demequina pelophila]
MANTITDPLLGRVIDGRYEVRERVAAGGMATVYLAFDRRLERDVALKVMHRHLEIDPNSAEIVRRFRREAKSAARLTHPGIVHVYDQGVDDDVSYLTMEYVAGENLRERMAHEGTLSLGEALATAEQVLDALASAHRQGLVHQDVKPENVLIDAEGRPRVADFGLARAVTEVTSTTAGTIMGTVAYLGPELITTGVSDARTDVYAVGVLLYEMVTGRQPFTGATALDVAGKHVHESVPAPSSHVAWLPPEVDALVAHMTARDPGARPADAAAAVALVRQARELIDDPTLDRRADPPSGSIPARAAQDDDATAVLSPTPAGSTVALPIGLGHPFPAVGTDVAVDADDDPDAQEPPQQRNRAGWWVAAVVVALIAIGAGTLWWYNAIGPGAYTTVPPLEQEKVADAETILRAADLEFTVEQVNDDDVPEGVVISSEPRAQARVLNGTEVTLYVSDGPLMLVIPDVVGEQRGDAESEITETGFPLGEAVEEYSDTVPQGEVMSVEPAAGTEIEHYTEVTLTYSGGPAPITFPDVTGMVEEEALAALDEHALVVTIERARTEEAEEGVVFAQSPDGGTDGLRLDAITITVSEGPPLVTVGDYVGQPYDEAVAAAEAAGLEVSVHGKWPWSSRDIIIDQSVTPGARVEKGEGITLQYN